MDEARRFLRYVMPGLVFGVETLLFVWIVLPEWTVEKIAKVDGVAAVVGGIFASGALGYIFAAVHHFCVWNSPFDRDVLDHRDLANSLPEAMRKPRDELVSRKLVETGRPNASLIRRAWAYLIQPAPVDPRETAKVLTWAYWYGNPRATGDDGIPKEGRQKLDSLGDQAHGLGAARVASWFALMAALLICAIVGSFSFKWEPGIRWGGMVLLGMFLSFVFHRGFKRVARIAMELWERLMWRSLEKDAPGQKSQ